MEAVKRKAQNMEERARMQEKLIKVNPKKRTGNNGELDENFYNVEKTIAVNDMYIDAITAKLKILE
jgi:hypothetical protein